MTVEVIAPADPENMYTKNCGNCGVTLRYVKNDIYTHTVADYGGGMDVYHMILCPKCRYLNDVKQYPVVKNVWNGRIIGGKGYLPGDIPENEL